MNRIKKVQKNNKGFTLVELIIVVAIIAILIAMIAPNLTSFLGTASDTAQKANAKTAYTSVNAWLTQQRVEGKSVGTSTEIKLSGGALTASNTFDDSICSMFNAGEFGDNTTLSIKIDASAYSVIAVEWKDNAGTEYYPSEAAWNAASGSAD